MANPIVNTLPAYVDEQRLPLIAKTVLAGDKVKMLNLQTDVKGKTALNLLSTDITLQDAHECGFTPAGTQELSQRYIEPAYLKVNMEYCDKLLLGKWAQYEVQIAAGNKTLPFEEEFISEVINKVQAEVERRVFEGVKATDEFDGLITIAKNDGGVSSAYSASDIFGSLWNLYQAIPASAHAADTTIFVSHKIFDAFVHELIVKNMYHYNPTDEYGVTKLPGTNVDVVAVDNVSDTFGLCGRLSNLFYGVDMANDDEKFDFWYSKDNGTFRLAIEFVAGTQIAFPDEVSYLQ